MREVRQQGSVLMVTVWVILVLTGLALVFARSMRVEAAAAAGLAARVQAEAVSRGAVAYVLDATLRAAQDPAALSELHGEAVQVGDGAFWVLSGIEDEASRVNLNTAGQDVLAALPGMTAGLAAAVVDWRDTDAEVTPGGAESEAYLLGAEPHLSKDAPLETVEEVTLLAGATPGLLWGEDANRNGVMDPGEDVDMDGRLDSGIGPFVTVYSHEPNLDAQGRARVFVNSPDTRPVADLLRPVVHGDRFFQVMDRVRGGRPFASTLDFYRRTGLTKDEFAAVADRLTDTPAPVLVGRINVFTAPRAVLRCLPGLDDADVDAILVRRADQGTPRDGTYWIADVLSPEKAAAVGRLITHRGLQHSADIVAVSADRRAFVRTRIVIDTLGGRPRVIRCQDLTQLGWPLASEAR